VVGPSLCTDCNFHPAFFNVLIISVSKEEPGSSIGGKLKSYAQRPRDFSLAAMRFICSEVRLRGEIFFLDLLSGAHILPISLKGYNQSN
jgi:hypothetical protein